jgi:hypothetical protein
MNNPKEGITEARNKTQEEYKGYLALLAYGMTMLVQTGKNRPSNREQGQGQGYTRKDRA